MNFLLFLCYFNFYFNTIQLPVYHVHDSASFLLSPTALTSTKFAGNFRLDSLKLSFQDSLTSLQDTNYFWDNQFGVAFSKSFTIFLDTVSNYIFFCITGSNKNWPGLDFHFISFGILLQNNYNTFQTSRDATKGTTY